MKGTKEAIRKIDEAWQKKAESENKNIAVVKCAPAGKQERIRGIMV